MITITDHSPEFKQKVFFKIRGALNETARDILIDATNKAPFVKGGLRSDKQVKSPEPLVRHIIFGSVYAGYQERGERKDGSRKVKKYTTPGTGKHFLRNAAKKHKPNFIKNIKKHLRGF